MESSKFFQHNGFIDFWEACHIMCPNHTHIPCLLLTLVTSSQKQETKICIYKLQFVPSILSLELDQKDILRMVTRKWKSQQCFVFWNQGYCSSVMLVCQALLGIFCDKSVNRSKEITIHFQSKIEKITYSVYLFFNHIQILIYTDPGTSVPSHTHKMPITITVILQGERLTNGNIKEYKTLFFSQSRHLNAFLVFPD